MPAWKNAVMVSGTWWKWTAGEQDVRRKSFRKLPQ